MGRSFFYEEKPRFDTVIEKETRGKTEGRSKNLIIFPTQEKKGENNGIGSQ